MVQSMADGAEDPWTAGECGSLQLVDGQFAGTIVAILSFRFSRTQRKCMILDGFVARLDFFENVLILLLLLENDFWKIFPLRVSLYFIF